MFVLAMVSGPGYSSGDPGHGRTPGYHSDAGLLSPSSPLEACQASWVNITPEDGPNTSFISGKFQEKIDIVVEAIWFWLNFHRFGKKTFHDLSTHEETRSG